MKRVLVMASVLVLSIGISKAADQQQSVSSKKQQVHQERVSNQNTQMHRGQVFCPNKKAFHACPMHKQQMIAEAKRAQFAKLHGKQQMKQCKCPCACQARFQGESQAWHKMHKHSHR